MRKNKHKQLAKIKILSSRNYNNDLDGEINTEKKM